jgi:hypothetical protein
LGRLFLAGVFICLGVTSGRADELAEFTGYTRPGTPEGKAASKEGKIIFADFEGKNQRAVLGGTVYFTVIEMGSRDSGDIWRKIGSDMVQDFVPGQDGDGGSSPPFDSSARCLYLYQTVNDMPEVEDAIRSTSVYLIEARLLTSWGYFASHGLAAESEDGKGKSLIRPLSTEYALDNANRYYRRWDSEHLADTPLIIGKYPSRGKGDVRPVAKGEDPVRNEDNVVLAFGSDLYYRSALWTGFGIWPRRPTRTLDSELPAGAGARPTEMDYLDRSYLRANWFGKNALKPGERGALFGFTSNYPPTYDDVRLRGLSGPGQRGDIKPAATDNSGIVPAAGNAPVGSVPVPVPPAAGATGAFAGGTVGGLLGGFAPTAGGIPGGGLGAGGLGGVPAIAAPGSSPSSGGGGTPVVGTGNGSGQSPNQNQPQSQNQNQFFTINNQAPSQSQSQSQSQSPTSCSCMVPGTVIPAPPAFFLAAMGIPFLLFCWRPRNEMKSS